MVLRPDERAVFVDRGLVHLPGLVPTTRTRLAKDCIIAELERLGARVGSKWQVAKVPQQLRHQAPFDGVIPNELVAHLDKLAGCALLPAQGHPQILLTPPGKGPWSVPAFGWHLDVASPSRDELPGIQVFVLLDDVAPTGGGTVAICGSHKLHAPKGGVAVSAHQTLRSDPVYAALFSPSHADRQRFLRPLVVRGVTLQVVEMCGRAGDVYLMDMRTVHAPAPNATKTARMMLTARYLVRPPRE